MSTLAYQSYAEFYADSDYAKFPHTVRAGGSTPVEFVRSQQSAHDFIDPALPQLLLVISLASDMPFRWDLGDGFIDERRIRTGDMVLCPPDTQIAYDCGGDHEAMAVCFSSEHVAALLAEEGGPKLSAFDPISESAVLRDERIRHAALEMWRESVKGDRASTLLIDGYVQTILGHLLRRANASLDMADKPISPKALAEIDAFIDANCDERFNTVDLATLAGMSRFQFSRSFKATTGVTPHAYLLEWRIARARGLLEEGALPLVEIALACGFSSQSHMTDVFRQKLGITPGRYRKDVKG